MRPGLARRAALATVRFVLSTTALLLLASVLVFALVRSAPGDPVEVEFGESGVDALLTETEQAAARDARREELGLDGTLVEQYLRWLDRVVHLDLGVSYRTDRPVVVELGERLSASAVLGLAGFGVAVALAVSFALVGARRPGSPGDHATRVAALVLAAVPTFLSGSLLLRLAAEGLDYPLAGPASLEKLWLPALVMGASSTATMSRVLRASLVAERGRPYATAAAARGAGPGRVLLRHVARPATAPVMTLAGLALASLVAASVITETIFAWPGVSAYAVGAIAAQDYAVVQAYVLLVVLVVVVVNRGVDAVQSVMDPRVRLRAEVAA